MILQPLGYRALLRRRKITKSKGGLYLPEKSEEMKDTIAEVIAVGEEVRMLKPGDKVSFSKYTPHKIDDYDLKEHGVDIDEDYDFMIINEEDALCILLDRNPLEMTAADFGLKEVSHG